MLRYSLSERRSMRATRYALGAILCFLVFIAGFFAFAYVYDMVEAKLMDPLMVLWIGAFDACIFITGIMLMFLAYEVQHRRW